MHIKWPITTKDDQGNSLTTRTDQNVYTTEFKPGVVAVFFSNNKEAYKAIVEKEKLKELRDEALNELKLIEAAPALTRDDIFATQPGK